MIFEMRQPATRITPNLGNRNRKIYQTMVWFSLVLWIVSVHRTVLYLAPYTPGGLQVVLVDLVDSLWSPPGFYENSDITTKFFGVHLESTGVQMDSNWTPHEPH